jgi:hypothetical protein
MSNRYLPMMLRLRGIIVPLAVALALPLSCGGESVERRRGSAEEAAGGTVGGATTGGTGATAGSGIGGGTGAGGPGGASSAGTGAGTDGGGAGRGGSSGGQAGTGARGGRGGRAGSGAGGIVAEGGAAGFGDRPDCDTRVAASGIAEDQAAVDELWAVTEVTGDVVIYDATSLLPLACLERIGGSLEIALSASLESLEGLERLTSVGGDLVISNLPKVESLSPLSNLEDVGGEVVIKHNPRIQDLIGLGALGRTSSVSIDSNAGLTTLVGFDRIAWVGSLIVVHNESLRQLGALEGLGPFEGSLTFANNGLPDWSQLRHLTEVGGDLMLRERVPDLAGLSDLRTVGGTLFISDVSSVRGLDMLESVGWLVIQSNVLTSLSGLGSFTITESMAVQGERLTDLTGIANPRAGGSLSLSDCPNLVSLAGLSEGVYPGGVDLSYLGIVSLQGMEGMSLTGGLRLRGNDSLVSLAGLAGHTTLGALTIHDNGSLQNLDGLESLTTIDGNLEISDYHEACDEACGQTDVLSSLRGLSGLNYVGGELRIMDNLALATCEAEWLRDQIGLANIGGGAFIAGNADNGTCTP